MRRQKRKSSRPIRANKTFPSPPKKSRTTLCPPPPHPTYYQTNALERGQLLLEKAGRSSAKKKRTRAHSQPRESVGSTRARATRLTTTTISRSCENEKQKTGQRTHAPRRFFFIPQLQAEPARTTRKIRTPTNKRGKGAGVPATAQRGPFLVRPPPRKDSRHFPRRTSKQFSLVVWSNQEASRSKAQAQQRSLDRDIYRALFSLFKFKR